MRRKKINIGFYTTAQEAANLDLICEHFSLGSRSNALRFLVNAAAKKILAEKSRIGEDDEKNMRVILPL